LFRFSQIGKCDIGISVDIQVSVQKKNAKQRMARYRPRNVVVLAEKSTQVTIAQLFSFGIGVIL